MQIHVKLEHFIEYQKIHGTYYLDKKNKYFLNSNSKQKLINSIFKSETINEMLDGTKTNYEFFLDDDNYEIQFKTKSNKEYRFDLFNEPNTNIYHLGFSNKYSNKDNYNIITGYNESIEVFSRLSYILKDINKELNVKEYCIGATGDEKKDRIYEYFMKYVKSFEKRQSDYYDLGWALYFKI